MVQEREIGSKTKFKELHFAAKNLIIFKWAFFAYSIIFLAWGFLISIAGMKDVWELGMLNVFNFAGKMAHDTYLKRLKEKKEQSD